LHKLQFQLIDAGCVEVVALLRHVCFYVLSQNCVICFWSNEPTLNFVQN